MLSAIGLAAMRSGSGQVPAKTLRQAFDKISGAVVKVRTELLDAAVPPDANVAGSGSHLLVSLYLNLRRAIGELWMAAM